MQASQALAHSAPVACAPTYRRVPQVRKKYTGSIVFTHGEMGDLIPIRSSFPLLPASDAFRDHLMEFVAERAAVAGTVYKFEGTYMLFKNGKPSFSGHISEIAC